MNELKINWVQSWKKEQHQLLQWHLDFRNGGGIPDTKYGPGVTFPDINLKSYVHEILLLYIYIDRFYKRNNRKVSRSCFSSLGLLIS